MLQAKIVVEIHPRTHAHQINTPQHLRSIKILYHQGDQRSQVSLYLQLNPIPTPSKAVVIEADASSSVRLF